MNKSLQNEISTPEFHFTFLSPKCMGNFCSPFFWRIFYRPHKKSSEHSRKRKQRQMTALPTNPAKLLPLLNELTRK
ncbi:unnamed protein product [Ceratitis capitata]|uniref:(Mediterranean fruit fly) hypothetical protein n=1 Tax=Ceratitis capitata TaxID=7213 RepID=A0A811VBJ0_CERCA|nr:unnamed protein product [Ceratitis capitata]